MIGKLSSFVTLLLFAMGSQVATAATSFQGTIWTLSYSGSPLPDSDPLSETYRVLLNVNTSGYTGTGSFLDQVALKVSSSLKSVSLFSAPGLTSDWVLLGGGINARGCSGSGSGFECANSASTLNAGKGVPVPVGSNYQWTFDLKMANGALFTGIDEASVKGRFVNTLGVKVGGLVSENVTLTSPVPEPENYAMLLAGLGVVGLIARRRLRRP